VVVNRKTGGGKETGQRMSDYIIPGGRFDQSYDKLAATGWGLNLQSAHRPGGTRAPSSKTKFTCPKCGQNIFGKPSTDAACRVCNPNAEPRMVAETEAVARSYDQAAE
jgi:hypothetical protein